MPNRRPDSLAGRDRLTTEPDAARALLDAVGSDLRELAAACDQLAADTDGPIDEAVVARYYRGRAEATGFTVADRAVEGHLAPALEQLRWALATGVSPVLICSALAQGVRLLGRVGSAPRGASSAALAADTDGPIDESVVARYYRGRAEATGFTVADRAVEGHLAPALEQLRWALATGVSPVLICSALAQGVRLLGRVGSAPRGASSVTLAAEVGAPPWKIDRVRQQLRGWHPNGIARALHAVAEADAQVKGEATSAAYALERAVRRIVAARAGDDLN